MILNNARLGGMVQYFSIQFVEKKWIAWFYEELSTADPIFDEGIKK